MTDKKKFIRKNRPYYEVTIFNVNGEVMITYGEKKNKVTISTVTGCTGTSVTITDKEGFASFSGFPFILKAIY